LTDREGAVMPRRRVIAGGRVQGVFFRAECRSEAEALGVDGWVRNRPDGTVEAVFEGEASRVEAMVAWMRFGPALAVVDRVDVFEEEPEGLTGFAIRHG
jgi:acylphosphatase